MLQLATPDIKIIQRTHRQIKVLPSGSGSYHSHSGEAQTSPSVSAAPPPPPPLTDHVLWGAAVWLTALFVQDCWHCYRLLLLNGRHFGHMSPTELLSGGRGGGDSPTWGLTFTMNLRCRSSDTTLENVSGFTCMQMAVRAKHTDSSVRKWSFFSTKTILKAANKQQQEAELHQGDSEPWNRGTTFSVGEHWPTYCSQTNRTVVNDGFMLGT